MRDGAAAAAVAFPEVAAHLDIACADCVSQLAELTTALTHQLEISRALTRQATARRYIEESGAEEPVSSELERYYHNRWDPDTLADVNALHDELERRLKDYEDG